MNRKQALALAAATTLVLGSTMVAGAAVGGVAILGFGGDQHRGLGSYTPAASLTPTTEPQPRVVTRTHDVYDPVVVDDGSGAATPAPRAGNVVPVAEAPVAANGNRSSDSPTPPAKPVPGSGNSGSPAPASVATTPTTRVPPGVEIPEDWPPGKPIPPIPPNCHEPHLEDNGVWNCGDD